MGIQRKNLQPPCEVLIDEAPMAESREALRDKISRLSPSDLENACEAALRMCELNGRVTPRAAFVQQFVEAWRELVRRKGTAKIAK